ncbi:16S rRNA (cytosine(1402)-N(4))-methyltransferase RsmH [Companilactobacillus allii]|uniref:Ribosomal RNA small subunit methyltransferase H n=1 Tax=Companilactobacillus allii TaxID=1847728 RepID=A0A1P8Q5C4_9LACO|nr:16S rRNA (cytosine(1402)-N(4))-methyltransferase RsmH [Companilactobacillus allii]APX73056.1 16S rRNA (cytosine(1402)-N(4))-methyltransferase [Companilactobacillus allii]USQ67856.1 16S rRNA (cytosine(1402)-N(4))-methyltransferase RsmH [Companilactobacillus allii]
MTSNEFTHKTVLLKETIDEVNPRDNAIFVDATFGRGGHTKELLSRMNNSTVYAFDRDETAIEAGRIIQNSPEIIGNNKLVLIRDNFENMKERLNEINVMQVDGIVYDLGVSSPQFDDAIRGFSYKKEARLDMRMDQRQELDAEKIVNDWSYNELVSIFYKYGDESFSKQIARSIERIREDHRITSTVELADIIKNAIPAARRRTGGHPAKRVFQAIRIAVNDELGSLEKSLDQAISLLASKGRISVITFQSKEDRIVKHIFKENSEIDLPRGLPVIPDNLQPPLKQITRKPILPTEEELDVNNRAHSAKLRVVEKI